MSDERRDGDPRIPPTRSPEDPERAPATETLADVPAERPRHRARHRDGGLPRDAGPSGVPPVKASPWKLHYIPVYFWAGGVAGGSWLAATLEDVAGDGDRAVIRLGRYLAAGGIAAGSGLLVLDLGRPDRFLNMLRVFRPRSAMSLGSWGLAAFGALSGSGAALQLAEDLGSPASNFGRWSRGTPGRLLHLAGLPLALFVGSYTGVLISSTSNPTWAERANLLAPLFVASAASSGLAAVAALARLGDDASDSALRRLARAELVSVAVELALAAADQIAARQRVPSARRPDDDGLRRARWITLAAGMAAPLALGLVDVLRDRGRVGRRRGRRGSRGRLALLASGLAVAGSLGLRLLTTAEGRRSANSPDDTWAHTALEPEGRSLALPDSVAPPTGNGKGGP